MSLKTMEKGAFAQPSVPLFPCLNPIFRHASEVMVFIEYSHLPALRLFIVICLTFRLLFHLLMIEIKTS